MANTDNDAIVRDVILGGVLFFVAKSVLNNFGVSSEDTAKVTDQAAVTPSENPFSPNFQPFLDNWTANQPAGLSVSDGMVQLSQLADSGQVQTGSQGYNVITWYNTIADALSVWNWRADTNAVFAVFNQMSTQIQCASLAAYCAYAKNKDLLTWLHYGGSAIPFIPNGLSYSQIAQIVDKVNNLPEQ